MVFRRIVTLRKEHIERKALKTAIQNVTWMASCELLEVEALKHGFNEAKRIESIYLSPSRWLGVAHPCVFQLSQIVNLTEAHDKLSWAASGLRVLLKRIKRRDWRSMIEYLERRLTLMNERFAWATHHEQDITPQDAVQAKFEAEREMRTSIAAFKRQYEKESGREY